MYPKQQLHDLGQSLLTTSRGLGSAMIVDGMLVPMELAALPIR
jgi:hypothetical protein